MNEKTALLSFDKDGRAENERILLETKKTTTIIPSHTARREIKIMFIYVIFIVYSVQRSWHPVSQADFRSKQILFSIHSNREPQSNSNNDSSSNKKH